VTVKELVEKTGLETLVEYEDREITGVFVSDMVSDVMAGAKSGNVWLTIQTHKSIIPAANLVDVSAVIITSGKAIPKETVDLAAKHAIALLSTELPTFEIIGKFYALGLGK
jgi:serine kinase of HPr protein (carbohydrate metabolism regulator)